MPSVNFLSKANSSSYIGSINGVCLSGFPPRSTTKTSSGWIGVIGMKPWIEKPTHEILDSGGDTCVNSGGGPGNGVDKGSGGYNDDGGCGVDNDDGDGSVECFNSGLGFGYGFGWAQINCVKGFFFSLSILGWVLLDILNLMFASQFLAYIYAMISRKLSLQNK